MPEPLHIGDTAQYKIGNLTLGTSTMGSGKLNICQLNDSCNICLNGDCIDEWPTGGSGYNYWWYNNPAPPNYLYPINNPELPASLPLEFMSNY